MTTTTTAPASITLAEHSATLDAMAGRELQFADTVAELFVTRTQVARLTKARRAVYEFVKDAHALGISTIDGTEYIIREAVIPATQYRAVDSATVKKADPRLWERAKAVSPFVQVKAPSGRDSRIPVIDTPDASGYLDASTAVRLYAEHPAWTSLRILKTVERDKIEHLHRIAAIVGWDGELLTFDGGWSIQLSRLQFSAERLAEIEPQRFNDMAVTKTRRPVHRVYVARIDGSDIIDEAGE